MHYRPPPPVFISSHLTLLNVTLLSRKPSQANPTRSKLTLHYPTSLTSNENPAQPTLLDLKLPYTTQPHCHPTKTSPTTLLDRNLPYTTQPHCHPTKTSPTTLLDRNLPYILPNLTVIQRKPAQPPYLIATYLIYYPTSLSSN